MKTACILYGFCEGPQVSKRFCAGLEKLGYRVIADPSQADLIIGHSGGCFLLPEHIRAQRILQIGIVHWPGRSVLGSLLRKLAADIKNHHREGALQFWVHKTFWNFVYFWRPLHVSRMLQGRKRGLHWRYGALTTVVRPELDVFCTPELQKLPFAHAPRFVRLPGQHDDCWRNPTPYLKLLQSK